jgi:hypothetical protein
MHFHLVWGYINLIERYLEVVVILLVDLVIYEVLFLTYQQLLYFCYMIILHLSHFIVCLENLDGVSDMLYYERYFSQYERVYYDLETLSVSEKIWRKKNEIIKKIIIYLNSRLKSIIFGQIFY